MASPNPACTVKDGAGSPQSTPPFAVVTPGATVTVALVSSAGVNTWSLQCTSADETTVPATINAGVSLNGTTKTATFTAPTAGRAMVFQSVVNGGVDTNGTARADWVTTFKVATLTTMGYVVGAVGETFEHDATYGSTAILNTGVRAAGTGGGGGGSAALTTTTASFTMPAVNATVSVTLASTALLSAGLPVVLSGAGSMQVASVTSGTVAVLLNLGGPSNAAPASTVSSGTSVFSGGLTATGYGAASSLTTTGAVSAGSVTAGTFVSVGLTVPSTGAFRSGPGAANGVWFRNAAAANVAGVYLDVSDVLQVYGGVTGTASGVWTAPVLASGSSVTAAASVVAGTYVAVAGSSSPSTGAYRSPRGAAYGLYFANSASANVPGWYLDVSDVLQGYGGITATAAGVLSAPTLAAGGSVSAGSYVQAGTYVAAGSVGGLPATGSFRMPLAGTLVGKNFGGTDANLVRIYASGSTTFADFGNTGTVDVGRILGATSAIFGTPSYGLTLSEATGGLIGYCNYFSVGTGTLPTAGVFRSGSGTAWYTANAASSANLLVAGTDATDSVVVGSTLSPRIRLATKLNQVPTAVAVTASPTTITATQANAGTVVLSTTTGAAFTVNWPLASMAAGDEVVITNSSAFAATVNIVGGTGIVIAAGKTAMFYVNTAGTSFTRMTPDA